MVILATAGSENLLFFLFFLFQPPVFSSQHWRRPLSCDVAIPRKNTIREKKLPPATPSKKKGEEDGLVVPVSSKGSRKRLRDLSLPRSLVFPPEAFSGAAAIMPRPTGQRRRRRRRKNRPTCFLQNSVKAEGGGGEEEKTAYTILFLSAAKRRERS